VTELDVMEDLTQRQREILELLGGADVPLSASGDSFFAGTGDQFAAVAGRTCQIEKQGTGGADRPRQRGTLEVALNSGLAHSGQFRLNLANCG